MFMAKTAKTKRDYRKQRNMDSRFRGNDAGGEMTVEE